MFNDLAELNRALTRRSFFTRTSASLGSTALASLLNPSLFAAMPYDTLKAFAPITLVSTVSLLLTVTGDFPAKSTQELIAYAKANAPNNQQDQSSRKHRG